MLKSITIVAALALTGCASRLPALPAVATTGPTAFKMIRPGAVAESCRTAWFGGSDETVAPAMADAFARLKAIDPEVETMQDAQIAIHTINVGVVRRDCVEVTANLGRNVPLLVVEATSTHLE